MGLLLATALGCSAQRAEERTHFEEPAVYFSSIKELYLEVHYETGAAPYSGTLPSGDSLWEITQANLKAVFEPRGVAIHVPTSLSQMKEFPDPNPGSDVYTAAQIGTLADRYQRFRSTSSRAVFLLMYLNGNYEASSGPSKITGVSLSGTNRIALFKPAIRSAEGRPFVAEYVEQSTQVHELGHALGLVGNGIPVVSDHRDTQHGAHCKNPQCVMYWLNEGRNDLKEFVERFIATGELLIFDTACLEDTRRFRP